ncbi:hypothetical protein EVG20_g7235 [Dentipellis fragilis]|uniref:Uncharacterized protein n=1 Tax=Dentipellis fragilis TaxID=205917 RepID=A0A4Y9YEH3_9AGAM|nr:hypothetical protein EVG20_g7235 [Dentipellis fragilis]
MPGAAGNFGTARAPGVPPARAESHIRKIHPTWQRWRRSPPPRRSQLCCGGPSSPHSTPIIAQVYTTYDGDAHRGNWGLKRPLPLRARDRYITVQSVDSREQQTEWKHAQGEARWIKRWDELGVQPKAQGLWDQQTGRGQSAFVMDSDFALATRDAVSSKSKAARLSADGTPMGEAELKAREDAERLREKEHETAAPNVAAMSEREFQRYLEDIRAQRPEFKKFLQEQYAQSLLSGGKQKLKVASRLSEEFALGSAPQIRKGFLKKYACKLYSSPESTIIGQQPHSSGGATYAKISPLTTYYTTKPQPGRVLAFKGAGAETKGASFAGMVSHINGWVSPTRGSDKISVRLASARLIAPPQTVAEHPAGLDFVRMTTKVSDQAQLDRLRTITVQPGTREYIQLRPTGQGRRSTIANMTQRSIPKGKQLLKPKTEQASRDQLIDNLKHLVNQSRSGI